MLLVIFFLVYLFSVKIILQIMFNNVLDRKETFFGRKKFNISSPKNIIFPKGLTDAFGQKCIYFSLFVFGQNKTRKNV